MHIMEKRFEIQDRDYEDEVEFTPKVRGVNEESISFDDPEVQAKEKEALMKVMLESALYYNVTSVLKVSLSFIYFGFYLYFHVYKFCSETMLSQYFSSIPLH